MGSAPTFKDMWLFGLTPKSRAKVKRRNDRFNAESLSTPLGAVKDLSVSGVRIAGTGKTRLVRGQVIPVRLQNIQHALNFTGKVAWVRQSKRGFEAGILLMDVKPNMARILQSLGELGFIPVTGDPVVVDPPPSAPVVRSPDDPYEVLGVNPSATDEQVQKAYRALARKCHPDADPSAEAAIRFARITEAHRTLQRTRLRAPVSV